MITAIIPAGGSGSRFAKERGDAPSLEKQFLPLCGKPVLVHSIEALQQHPLIEAVILALPASRIGYVKNNIVQRYALKDIHLVAGGESRQKSVLHALRALPEKTTHIVVHDAVRPCVTFDVTDRVIQAAKRHGAAIAAIPVTDTLKRTERNIVLETVDRNHLIRVQTPQVFERSLLEKAYQHASEHRIEGTDDASLLESAHIPVFSVTGSSLNIKITYPEDIAVAEAFLNLCQKE